MSQVYFGRRWDAPAFDEAEKIATPVGECCGFCGEEIRAEESGTAMLFAEGTVAGQALVSGLRPVHIECYLRSVLGDVFHLQGRCSCSGGDGHDERPYRIASKAALDWMLSHGMGRFADDEPRVYDGNQGRVVTITDDPDGWHKHRDV